MDIFAPLADMLNHRIPRQTQWFYSDLHKAFMIQSMEDIPAGTEVYDSYGKKCNSRFLLNYGFTLEDNDSNEYPIQLTLEENDPYFIYKKQVIGGVATRTFKIQDEFNDIAVISLLNFLRIAHFNDGHKNLVNVSK